MLKEQEKRTLLIVILGVSLVSLVAALVSGVVSGLMYVVNGGFLRYTSTDYLEIGYGVIMFVGMGLGIAYLTTYLIKKDYKNKIVFGLLITIAVYFVLSTTGLYLWFAIDQKWDLEMVDFSYFENYIAAMLTVLISSVLVTLASHFLHKSNQKEKQIPTSDELNK